MTNQFKCNSQSIFLFHKQLAHEKKIFKHDKSPFGAVSDPGGGSGDPDPPPPQDLALVWDWNAYTDRILHHFLTGGFFSETPVAFCH